MSKWLREATGTGGGTSDRPSSFHAPKLAKPPSQEERVRDENAGTTFTKVQKISTYQKAFDDILKSGRTIAKIQLPGLVNRMVSDIKRLENSTLDYVKDEGFQDPRSTEKWIPKADYLLELRTLMTHIDDVDEALKKPEAEGTTTQETTKK